MKLNSNLLISIIIALGIGLVAGYFLFGNAQNSFITEDIQDHKKGSDSMEMNSDDKIWTCSMHPQIRQEEPGDCPICGMDLIPAESGNSNDPLVLQMTPAAVKLANIQTSVIGVENGASNNSIPLSGKVHADERLASSQVAHVPGRIEKLFVTFTGEQVSKGQQIATIYSPDLINAQRELLEAVKLADLNPSLLEAARKKLKYWKIGAQTISEIEQHGNIQETFTLFADETGIVTNKRVAVGDYLKKGEPLFDLMNLRKVWVLFDAYEENLQAIKIGDQIEFTTASQPGKKFKTKVTFIDPIINPTTRVTSIRTEIKNTAGLLKPEMFVQGTIKVKSKNKSTLSVPKSAVLWTGTRSVVYIKIPDSTIPSFKFTEIEIGESQGSNYQILIGLNPGDEVVTYGSFTIDAASQLNNQASMMNRNVTIKEDKHIMYLPDFTESTPAIFKEQLMTFVQDYLQLKDALVQTDVTLTKSSGIEMVNKLNKIDSSILNEESQIFWKEQLIAIRAHTNEIINSIDIEIQRAQFDFLSQALIQSIKVFGTGESTLYVQHCPMANENKGADWLSSEKEVLNPYFGDKMLKCGLVKTTINSLFKNPTPSKMEVLNTHKH